jgi:hypothetical protein
VRSRRAEGCQRKKKRGGVRGTHLQNQKVQGSLGKVKFPIDLNPNEEMPKIEVGEFFKPYNITLEFKFRNPKYTI